MEQGAQVGHVASEASGMEYNRVGVLQTAEAEKDTRRGEVGNTSANALSKSGYWRTIINNGRQL